MILVDRVAVPRANLPKFWSFMYRVSPATYIVGGIMSTAVAHLGVTCAEDEILRMMPPENITCGEFLSPFIEQVGGILLNPGARNECRYCPFASTNEFLARYEISYGTRWRDFGFVWAYIVVNIIGTLGFYWILKVPKGKGSRRA